MPLNAEAQLVRAEKKRVLVRHAEGQSIILARLFITDFYGMELLEDALTLYVDNKISHFALPDGAHSSPSNPFTYPFHVFAALQFPLAPPEKEEFLTAAQTILNSGAKHLDPNIRDFLQSANRKPYRWLLIKEIETIGFLTVLDILTEELFRVHDVELASCAQPGHLIMSMIFQMWGDDYLLGCFPSMLPGTAEGELLSVLKSGRTKFEASNVLKAYETVPRAILEGSIKRNYFIFLCAKHALENDRDLNL